MKYANRMGYTDIDPYEVVRVVSDKTLEIRGMKSERPESFKPEFVIGGFSAVCINQLDQEWVITPDAEAPVLRIRKGKSGWKDAFGGKYRLGDEPVRFYDYNF
jgi:hypothetical protein